MGIKFYWSHAGTIPGKKCIKISEPADPHTWDDNVLFCFVFVLFFNFQLLVTHMQNKHTNKQTHTYKHI